MKFTRETTRYFASLVQQGGRITGIMIFLCVTVSALNLIMAIVFIGLSVFSEKTFWADVVSHITGAGAMLGLAILIEALAQIEVEDDADVL